MSTYFRGGGSCAELCPPPAPRWQCPHLLYPPLNPSLQILGFLRATPSSLQILGFLRATPSSLQAIFHLVDSSRLPCLFPFLFRGLPTAPKQKQTQSKSRAPSRLPFFPALQPILPEYTPQSVFLLCCCLSRPSTWVPSRWLSTYTYLYTMVDWTSLPTSTGYLPL